MWMRFTGQKTNRFLIFRAFLYFYHNIYKYFNGFWNVTDTSNLLGKQLRFSTYTPKCRNTCWIFSRISFGTRKLTLRKTVKWKISHFLTVKDLENWMAIHIKVYLWAMEFVFFLSLVRRYFSNKLNKDQNFIVIEFCSLFFLVSANNRNAHLKAQHCRSTKKTSSPMNWTQHTGDSTSAGDVSPAAASGGRRRE